MKSLKKLCEQSLTNKNNGEVEKKFECFLEVPAVHREFKSTCVQFLVLVGGF